MKSLFLRLLVSMWLTLTLLVGVFALIHAWAFPPEQSSVRRRFQSRGIELRAESALRCGRDRLPGCTRTLVPLDDRDQRVAIYRNGELLMGEAVTAAAEVEAEARRSEEHAAIRVGDAEVTAVVMDLDPSYVAVATGPIRSPWMFFIVPETLPHRLLAIVVVSGLVSVLLARWLSRPVHILRGATQQMAGGDLSVRVAPRLRGADGETQALGRDMDRMAERIQELQRLNAMIGELSTLSRLESGQGLERREAVQLAPLLEQVVADAGFEAEQRGSCVELRRRDDCSIDGDEELLRRAVENVLRNAVRFTEPGTTVEVDLERQGSSAAVRIRDHGPGVPASALADIFQPFYRVHDDRARGSGGTGIGLAITRRAVLLHGGDVEADNPDGGGLRVTLRLPLRAGARLD